MTDLSGVGRARRCRTGSFGCRGSRRLGAEHALRADAARRGQRALEPGGVRAVDVVGQLAELVGGEVLASSEDDRPVARRRFTSFEAAMEAFQAPLENRPTMREVAAGLEFGEIWIPASRPYIAVAERRGVPAAAYFSRGYVEVREPDGGYRVVVLPVNSLRAGGGSVERRLELAERATCPSCYLQMPASGTCDCRDA